MKSLIVLIAASLLLTSCATLNKSECQAGDWHAVGQNDASRGLKSSQFKAHTKACAKHGIVADNKLYTTGYEDGLEVFCQAQVGIRKGRAAEHYNGICPAELESDFLYGYLEGLDIALYRLSQSYALTKNKLARARYRRQQLDTADDARRFDQNIVELQRKLRDIKIKHRDLKATINKWSRSLRGRNLRSENVSTARAVSAGTKARINAAAFMIDDFCIFSI